MTTSVRQQVLIPYRPQVSAHWCLAKDGDCDCWRLMRSHYSARRYQGTARQRQFVGPGEKMVLVTSGNDALFVWRKFISMDRQAGINCAVFRNESDVLASDLIREADALAWGRWPDEARHYTYVNAGKVRSSNPGCCFKKAGWRECGRTKRGLIILEIIKDPTHD